MASRAPAPRLTLRTLLAYIDDTLEPDEARVLGKKVAESEEAKAVIERIKQVTRRRGLTAPAAVGSDADAASDPNAVAAYLSDNLAGEQVEELEDLCLDSDVHLAEVAACHQILTLVLTDPVRVPPTANQRMYKLVGAPASDPNRKPGKALPVGGIAPPTPEHPDADDPDAALLLGMQRYSGGGGRGVLYAAVGGVAAALAFAVFMALPDRKNDAPEVTPVTVATGPAPTITVPPVTGPAAPDPKKVEPKKVETPDPKKVVEAPEPKKVETPEPKKVDVPDPKVGGPKPEDLAPLGGNEEVGRIETPNSLVLTRAPDNLKWVRLDPAGRAAVRANDPVVALPGFKADVRLAGGVVVYLWGNTPEQVVMKPMVMESRVRFHPVAGGLDADFTIDTGRVYVTATKPGARVRVRVGTEVWDVTLRDDKSEVMAQSSSAFIPGTPYARTGGERPRTEAKLVVLRGTADFNAPARFKKFDGLGPWVEVAWDSKAAQLSDPHPAPKDRLFASRVPELEGEYGKAIQRGLGQAQKDLTNPEGIRVLLKERFVIDPSDKIRPGMTLPEILQLFFPTQWATYTQMAITDATDGDGLKDVLDFLRGESRVYARKAAVMAISNWVARGPEHTELLVKGMTEKGWLPEVADQFAQLMRGQSSADMRDPNAAVAGLNRLVELLDDQHLAIREAALGNLLAFYADADTFTPANRILSETDVGNRETPRAGADAAKLKAWEAFLNGWKNHAADIKRKILEKK